MTRYMGAGKKKYINALDTNSFFISRVSAKLLKQQTFTWGEEETSVRPLSSERCLNNELYPVRGQKMSARRAKKMFKRTRELVAGKSHSIFIISHCPMP